jgi:threonine aldolase
MRNIIDLRSDTITKPCKEMRKAMAQAQVGDDVLGDDATVNELERLTAEILGKEAALYVPSGTMANQIAVRNHTRPGDEMLLEENSHIYLFEAGGAAALSGVTSRLLKGNRGKFTANEVKNALRPKNVHFPPTKLVAIENTHNRGGGSVWQLDEIEEVQQAVQENNLKFHLDGARLWNAASFLNIAESEIAKYFDSVSVCFSKGLGAPVGSALCGSRDFIEEARHIRKQFGGGMRQAGIIAAGAIYAIKNNRDRLKQDHQRAKLLADELNAFDGLSVDSEATETNLVYIHTSGFEAEKLVSYLQENGVLVLATASHTIRAVTNLEVDDNDIRCFIEMVEQFVSVAKF